MELKKNDTVKLKISALGYNGEGISKDFVKPIFVPYALVDEEIFAKIILVKKDFYIGKIVEIIKPSEFRVNSPCPVFTKCGGCQLQHLDYKKQLEFKQNHIKDCFKKIANLDVVIDNTVYDTQYEYRNKFALPCGEKDGVFLLGMYANNSHRIIDIDNCVITENWNKDIIKIIKKFVNDYKITAYNEETYKGLLRHIVARKVGETISIILVINSKDFPHQKALIELLKKDLKQDFVLYLNINTQRNNVILGEKFIKVYGNDVLDNFEGIITPIHPNSFYQVNNKIKTLIYKRVLSQIQNTNVIDAYSGAGTISNYIAKHFKENNLPFKVFSVEIVPEAVEGAIKTSKLNKVDNIVNHILGDCAEKIPELIKLNPSSVVVLDPPRKGCDKKVLDSILLSNADKIFYISCDPSTLARDVKILSEKYKVESITPYDMFPNTKHVETVVLMSRKEK